MVTCSAGIRHAGRRVAGRGPGSSPPPACFAARATRRRTGRRQHQGSPAERRRTLRRPETGSGSMNTRWCVTTRRKPATTMGGTTSVPSPLAQASRALLSQVAATAWCSWSGRNAATSTFTSGITVPSHPAEIDCRSHRCRDVNPRGVERPATGSGPRQPLLDHGGQRGALPSGLRTSLGEQLVPNVNCRLHRESAYHAFNRCPESQSDSVPLAGP